MEEIIAPVEDIKFYIEYALEQQIGSQPLPFPGMDKSSAAVCSFFHHGSCVKGAACPYRHVRGNKSVVCKHWLRGLCKKGDDCEFLHEYDMSKMPECFFFTKFGSCSNKECPFLHIDPDAKIKDCPWYDRGFCKHGPHCKKRHVRRVMCQTYLNGFCLNGKSCKFQHPSFELPRSDDGKPRAAMTCAHCNEVGHRITHCFKLAPEVRQELMAKQAREQGEKNNLPNFVHLSQRPSLDTVRCYKCNEIGHYANKCPQGAFAFLKASA